MTRLQVVLLVGVLLAGCTERREAASMPSQAPPNSGAQPVTPPPPPAPKANPPPPPEPAQSMKQAPIRPPESVRVTASAPASAKQLPEGVVGHQEVFFATDRRALGNERFAGQPSELEQLRFGKAKVSIPKIHREGELERPFEVFSVSLPENESRHIVIQSRGPLEKDAFFAGVLQGMDKTRNGSAFVFVHGYNTSFDDALLRTGQLAWDTRFEGPAISYSWPSAGSMAKYASDSEMADWSVPHLADLLTELRARTGSRTVHLVAHSMGSRVLSHALDRIAARSANLPSRFQEIILAAPDLNQTVLRQLSKALDSSSDRVTLYSSEKDNALLVSSLLRGLQPRAGARASSGLGEKFDIIDASRAKRSLLGHTYFAEDSTLLGDIAAILRERLPPERRTSRLQWTGTIWRLGI